MNTEDTKITAQPKQGYSSFKRLVMWLQLRANTFIFNLLWSERVNQGGWTTYKVVSWRTALFDHRMKHRQRITYYEFPWEK